MDETERLRELAAFQAKLATLSPEELLALAALLERNAKNLNDERALVAREVARLKPKD